MFYIGLDLGQRRDHSAIVVVERIEVRRAFLPTEFDGLEVRHVERVPLGTPYPLVVDRVCHMASHPALSGQCSLAVDGTGVGAPIVDMLRAAQSSIRPGCEIRAVTITGGERASSYSVSGGTNWSVPKQDLMAGVQVLLERRELRIAQMAGTGSLLKELLDIRSTPGAGGRMRTGADGYGEHDDLVIALALACWSSQRKKSGFGTQRLTGI